MNKYRAQKTEVDGIVFASKREARRYSELKLLERAGKIRNLVLQPNYEIYINNQKICDYRADFVYMDTETNEPVTEDAKGMKTPVYKLKKKLIEAVYGIKILET